VIHVLAARTDKQNTPFTKAPSNRNLEICVTESNPHWGWFGSWTETSTTTAFLGHFPLVFPDGMHDL